MKVNFSLDPSSHLPSKTLQSRILRLPCCPISSIQNSSTFMLPYFIYLFLTVSSFPAASFLPVTICELTVKSSLSKVAADLLKQYREKFQGRTLTVTWHYLRESMSSYLSQPNPVTARWEGEDHLRNPTFQLDAFRVSYSTLFCVI